MDLKTQAILQRLQANPGGMTQADLASEFKADEILNAAKTLHAMRRLEVSKRPADGAPLFIAISADVADKFAGLPDECRVVYKYVKAAENRGIMPKDLQRHTGMNTVKLNKTLKDMETRRLVKCVSPVGQKTKKLWMLAELEPAQDISGGSFYVGGKLDSAMIEEQRERILDYISAKKGVSLDDIHTYITDDSGDKRSLQDLGKIVQTLELDRMIASQIQGGKQIYVRRSVIGIGSCEAIEPVPCIGCPVIHRCVPGGEVSPEGCQYMQKWLSLSW
jgi:DNA-directed RNA polymerase III subunit RPC6